MATLYFLLLWGIKSILRLFPASLRGDRTKCDNLLGEALESLRELYIALNMTLKRFEKYFKFFLFLVVKLVDNVYIIYVGF